MSAHATEQAPGLWRSSSWRRLIAAVGVSVLGDQLFSVALAAVLLERGSAAWVSSMFFVAIGVRLLLSTMAGRLADCRDRQRLLIVADVARAVVMCLICVGVAARWDLSALVVLFGASNCFAAIHRPAFAAWLPSVVRGEHLPAANSAEAAAHQFGWSIGPAIGALVAAITSPAWAAAINASTFVMAAVLTLAVTSQPDGRDVEPVGPTEGDLLEPLAAVKPPDGMPLWFWAVLALEMAQFGAQMVVFVWVADRRFALGGAGGGWFVAAAGVGGLLGSAVAPRLYRDLGPRRAIIGAVVASLLGFVALGLVPLAAALASTAAAGVADMLFETGAASFVQARTPSARLGRAFGRMEFVGITAQLIGVALAGLLVAA